MISWLLPASISFLFFGLWGLLSKYAVLYTDTKSALFLETLGVVSIGLVIFASMHFKLTVNIKGIGFALCTGMASAIGGYFFLIAANRGNITTVITFTGLYPLATIILAFFFLHETIHLKQAIGIFFALVAIILMST